jgi:hypothetical protein
MLKSSLKTTQAIYEHRDQPLPVATDVPLSPCCRPSAAVVRAYNRSKLVMLSFALRMLYLLRNLCRTSRKPHRQYCK